MRYDTSEFPGVKVTRLDDGRLQVENEANRPFEIYAGPGRIVVIAPGSSKQFELAGDTFSMGWHLTAEHALAAGEPPLDPAPCVVDIELEAGIHDAALGQQQPDIKIVEGNGIKTGATMAAKVLIGSGTQPATFADVLVDLHPDNDLDIEIFGPSSIENCVVLGAGALRKARDQYRELQLGDVVVYAHRLSLLSADEWNELPEPTREAHIQGALDLLRVYATSASTPGGAPEVEASPI